MDASSCQWDGCCEVQTLWIIALVNGMDAVNYKQVMSLTAFLSFPIMLSNWMEGVKSTNTNGC